MVGENPTFSEAVLLFAADITANMICVRGVAIFKARIVKHPTVAGRLVTIFP